MDRAGRLTAELLDRCAFPPPETAVACAVSGGADSLALLVLATAAGCRVTAVHVDHGLRHGSAAEADVVAGAAEQLGASFRAERVEVPDGPNLEARARAARYGVLPQGVLTGHTADDQAETVLLNLLRGAGLDGLAAMAGDPRRPLLALRRADTVALCDALGMRPVQDPSNDEPRFLRNRVRHELLPLLADLSDRDPVPLLCRTAEVCAESAAALVEQAAAIDPTDARALASASTALARVAVREWLREAGREHPPDRAAVDRVLDVAGGSAVATDVGDGWRVVRSRQRLVVVPPGR